MVSKTKLKPLDHLIAILFPRNEFLHMFDKKYESYPFSVCLDNFVGFRNTYVCKKLCV